MTHALWSDGFRREEREARRPGLSDALSSLTLGVLGLCALASEVAMSVLVAMGELTSPVGSWEAGLLGLGLGFVGPYAALLTWRSPSRASQPPFRRVVATAVVALGMAAITLPWLVLAGTVRHPVRLIPGPGGN